MLKELYTSLLKRYGANDIQCIELWKDIEKAYTSKNRYYHNLEHLVNIWHQLSEVKQFITNWDATLFAMFYHDFIYSIHQKNNEEKSAAFAVNCMKKISLPSNIIDVCSNQILATKSHDKSKNNDINYFTDADLSILGMPWHIYATYCKNVRNEYAIYPDFLYNSGRKKVLNHFLQMDRIFKTEYFNIQFETQAKQNLQNELKLLS